MPKLETRRIRECSGLECGGVDEALPVIHRVKILGWESKNRRQYLRESVQAEDYAEKVINLNHPAGPNAQRTVQDRFGWFESVTKDDSGVWGDLHFNPKHPYAEQFSWLAKNKPSLVGLSHDAVGTGHTKEGVFVVEKVIEVKSVDLVADPATTNGLFESMEPELTPAAPAAEEKSYEQQIGELIVAICKDEKTHPSEKREKVLKALKLFDEPEGEVEESEEEGSEEAEAEAEGGGEEEPEEEEIPKKTEESLQALASKYLGVKRLLETVDRLETKDRLREKTDAAHRLCEESKLPAVLVTKVFLAQLIECKDENAMKSLIEDRRSISNIQRPRSSGPVAGKGGELDSKSFAKALQG